MRSLLRCSPSRLRRTLQPTSRLASTSANPYPYPPNANPTPHQIFHLPRSATKAEVKARYYELVRIYHPDSPVSRPLPSATAQARFQSITAAYDALRGKSPHASSSGEPERSRTDFHNLSSAMWRARRQRRAELNIGLDDRWKDRMMLSAIVLAVAAWAAQTYNTRRQAISGARIEASPQISISPKPNPRRRKTDEEKLAAMDEGGPPVPAS